MSEWLRGGRELLPAGRRALGPSPRDPTPWARTQRFGVLRAPQDFYQNDQGVGWLAWSAEKAAWSRPARLAAVTTASELPPPRSVPLARLPSNPGGMAAVVDAEL